MTYKQKLRDPRWQKKRLEVLQRANWKCEECGSPDDSLQVHHSHYYRCLEPWDCPLELLSALCEIHHVQRQNIEDSLKGEVMKALRGVPVERLKKVFWEWQARAMEAAR